MVWIRYSKKLKLLQRSSKASVFLVTLAYAKAKTPLSSDVSTLILSMWLPILYLPIKMSKPAVSSGATSVRNSSRHASLLPKRAVYKWLGASSPQRSSFFVISGLTPSRSLTRRSSVVFRAPIAVVKNVKSGKSSWDRRRIVATNNKTASNKSFLIKPDKRWTIMVPPPHNQPLEVKVSIIIEAINLSILIGNNSSKTVVVSLNHRVVVSPIPGDQHRPHLNSSEEPPTLRW